MTVNYNTTKYSKITKEEIENIFEGYGEDAKESVREFIFKCLDLGLWIDVENHALEPKKTKTEEYIYFILKNEFIPVKKIYFDGTKIVVRNGVSSALRNINLKTIQIVKYQNLEFKLGELK
jgi:hypothetical protein